VPVKAEPVAATRPATATAPRIFFWLLRMEVCPSVGSPADPDWGPVALRPRLAPGLPFRVRRVDRRR
jgi:hypothetical protein